ncbi:MAG TPA: hypothetical protein EYP49_13580 [Anaerolineae bacterium]|nr:hypothetical protein [Anaerolineae bacterium]
MSQAAVKEIPFERLLSAVEHLDSRERQLLHDELIRQEEKAVIEKAAEAVKRFGLKSVGPLNYRSVQKVLDELRERLDEYERQSGLSSREFYVASRQGREIRSDEEAHWASLYETYHRLRAAKRGADIAAGRPVEPMPSGDVTVRQLTLAEVEEELHQFEARHGMPSAEFYASFKRGEQGDSLEAFRWAHAYSAYLTLRAGEDSQKPASGV